MKYHLKALFIAAAALSFTAHADDPSESKGIKARLYGGATLISPDQVNAVLAANGFRRFDKIYNFGGEMTFPILRIIEPGFRFNYRIVSDGTLLHYRGSLTQSTLMLITRVKFLDIGYLQLDAFAGIGSSDSEFKVYSTTSSAIYDRKFSESFNNNFGKTLGYSYGVSAALGSGYKFAFIEVGMDSNVVDQPRLQGANTGGTVNQMDLSGAYVLLGIMIDGTKK